MAVKPHCTGDVSTTHHTVQLPVEKMGYDGVISLNELIEGRRKVVGIKLVPTQLIVRGSTARPVRIRESCSFYSIAN